MNTSMARKYSVPSFSRKFARQNLKEGKDYSSY